MPAARHSLAHRACVRPTLPVFVDGANAQELHSLCEAMPLQALLSLARKDSSLLKALNKEAASEISLVYQLEGVKQIDLLTKLIKRISVYVITT